MRRSIAAFALSAAALGAVAAPANLYFPVAEASTLDKSKAEERVKRLIAEQLGVKGDELVNSASFVKDLGADESDMAELITTFEDEFDIEISDEEAKKITTVQEAVDFLT
jgi:acyl carrier protein